MMPATYEADKPDIEQVYRAEEQHRLQGMKAHKAILATKEQQEQPREPATYVAERGSQRSSADKRRRSRGILAAIGRNFHTYYWLDWLVTWLVGDLLLLGRLVESLLLLASRVIALLFGLLRLILFIIRHDLYRFLWFLKKQCVRLHMDAQATERRARQASRYEMSRAARA